MAPADGDQLLRANGTSNGSRLQPSAFSLQPSAYNLPVLREEKQFHGEGLPGN